MKTNLTRNALIGLAFIASLVMIYFGINFLKGINVFRKQNQYYAVFDDVSKLLHLISRLCERVSNRAHQQY